MQTTSAHIPTAAIHAEFGWPGVYALTVVFTLTTAALITLLLTLIPVGKARAATTGTHVPAAAAL